MNAKAVNLFPGSTTVAQMYAVSMCQVTMYRSIVPCLRSWTPVTVPMFISIPVPSHLRCDVW